MAWSKLKTELHKRFYKYELKGFKCNHTWFGELIYELDEYEITLDLDEVSILLEKPPHKLYSAVLKSSEPSDNVAIKWFVKHMDIAMNKLYADIKKHIE